jgi:PAS domain-containing protein
MKTLWKPLSVVSGLLLLLTYLLIQSRSPDLVLRARMHEGLQTLALHDAELTRDVLLARAGLLLNYDSLTQTGLKLRETLHTLHQESAAVSGHPGREIGPEVDALARVLQEKLALVEYFKSDNALLRNSSTYFAYAGQTLGEPLRGGGAAPTAEITRLSQAMLRFMQSPEAAARHEAQRAIQRLSQVPTLRADSEALTTHARLIVEVLPQVDALLGQIVAAPTAARAAAVQDAVLRHANRVEARAQVFRVLLYLVAVVLLGYLLHQFRRLRASARNLRRANLDLEREVAEHQRVAAALRTSEERFRAITESANDAIVSADESGRIVSWKREGRGDLRVPLGRGPGDFARPPHARAVPRGPRSAGRRVGRVPAGRTDDGVHRPAQGWQ